MSEVVRGYARTYQRLDGVREIHILTESSNASGTEEPCVVLPISEDGKKAGGFEEWMVDWMKSGYWKSSGYGNTHNKDWLALPAWVQSKFNSYDEVDVYIAEAIAALFPEEGDGGAV